MSAPRHSCCDVCDLNPTCGVDCGSCQEQPAWLADLLLATENDFDVEPGYPMLGGLGGEW